MPTYEEKNESTPAPGVGLGVDRVGGGGGGVQVSYPIRVDTTFVPTAFSPIVRRNKKKKKKKNLKCLLRPKLNQKASKKIHVSIRLRCNLCFSSIARA